MKHLALVQVNDRYGPNRFLPLAISYHWLSARQDAWVRNNCDLVDVLIEKEPPQDWIRSLSHPLDYLIMSCYVWNWQYNQSLAMAVKQQWPHCRVIIGGPQVPDSDPEFVRRNTWCDIAILGENEGILSEAIRCDSVEDIDGLDGVITINTKQVTLPSRSKLDNIASPILSGFFDDIIGLTEQKYGPTDSWHLTWETMRGCPYHCTFCDIGQDYWNKTVLFDMDRIRAEIKWMGDKKIEFVGVCDSNWGLFERDIEITKMVIESKLSTGYPKVFDVTWAKNNPERVRQIVELDHQAGTDLFRGVGLSMQTLSSQSLSRISRFNMQESKTHEALRFYHEKSIATWTELIWPLPGESLGSFKQGLQKLLDLGQHGFLSVHPLVVTHNAPMAVPEYITANKLQVKDVQLDLFWAEESDVITEKVGAVFATDLVTYEEMIQGHMLAHWLVVLYYYGWAHYVMTWLYRIKTISHIDFVESWISYWQQRPGSWIYQEHQEIQSALHAVYHDEKSWGRKVPGGGNILWEYKSSTCVRIHQSRDKWQHFLSDFLYHTYGEDLSDLVSLNLELCADWRANYPFVYHTRPEYLQCLFDYQTDTITIDHSDREVSDDLLFVKKAYHWRRRNLYWQCNTLPINGE